MAETREDLPRVPVSSGIRLTSEVRVQGIRPELLLGLLIVSDLAVERALMVVVTHIVDGRHMRNSLHYTGAAVDFMLDVGADKSTFASELAERLGADFDVVDEGTHIHVEYQPHVGAVT